jgi:hypothetical protein
LKAPYPVTPDGRYFLVKGRLWRRTDPAIPAESQAQLIDELMQARREKGKAMRNGDLVARQKAMRRIDEAKQQLDERGPVWWTDGAPDWNRHMAINTPYADWFSSL